MSYVIRWFFFSKQFAYLPIKNFAKAVSKEIRDYPFKNANVRTIREEDDE